jgi:hypothetical protein
MEQSFRRKQCHHAKTGGFDQVPMALRHLKMAKRWILQDQLTGL